jgi:hypothetical protein
MFWMLALTSTRLSGGRTARRNYAIAADSPYSHSIVPGGFDVTSYATRLTR